MHSSLLNSNHSQKIPPDLPQSADNHLDSHVSFENTSQISHIFACMMQDKLSKMFPEKCSNYNEFPSAGRSTFEHEKSNESDPQHDEPKTFRASSSFQAQLPKIVTPPTSVGSPIKSAPVSLNTFKSSPSSALSLSRNNPDEALKWGLIPPVYSSIAVKCEMDEEDRNMDPGLLTSRFHSKQYGMNESQLNEFMNSGLGLENVLGNLTAFSWSCMVGDVTKPLQITNLFLHDVICEKKGALWLMELKKEKSKLLT
mmetsp:Transcript_10499/g.39032  ORF Transcript_10499/g.39032 Transcript_10499/m.39032 type:complete len:255 (-) Transcript_10499:1672-2436(-)